MQIVSIAWSVKSCCLGNKKNNKFLVCWISPDSGNPETCKHQVSLSKTLYPRNLVLVSTQEDSA